MPIELIIVYTGAIIIIIGISWITSKLHKSACKKAHDKLCPIIDNATILNVWIERKVRVRNTDFRRTRIKVQNTLIIEVEDQMSSEVNKLRFPTNQLKIKYKTNMISLISRNLTDNTIYLSYENVKTREELNVR